MRPARLHSGATLAWMPVVHTRSHQPAAEGENGPGPKGVEKNARRESGISPKPLMWRGSLLPRGGVFPLVRGWVRARPSPLVILGLDQGGGPLRFVILGLDPRIHAGTVIMSGAAQETVAAFHRLALP